MEKAAAQVREEHQQEKPQAPAAVQHCPVEQPKIMQMYLDANRDGQVDDQPANYGNWQWGANGPGAVIMVRTRNYQPAENVEERIELKFRWKNNQPEPQEGWRATLEVDHPDRIHIYNGRQFNADLLNIDQPLALDHAPASLWMEAANFGADAQEASWRVRLTFTYVPVAGQQVQQIVQVRIAPWIMAADLDPTSRVWARRTRNQLNLLADEIEGFVGGGNFSSFVVAPEQPSKGFARDPMKSGFVSAPHCSAVVIQNDLDPASPLNRLPADAASQANGGVITRSLRGGDGVTGQDNGGNLMVSPPTQNDPFGRILYGGNDGPHVCHAAPFYRAQRLQHPLRLDSTWLRVGHVDEMLTFVRGADGQYKALLISPRLGYLMLWAAASDLGHDSADALINWAVAANNRCIQAGPFNEDTFRQELPADGDRVAVPDPPVTYGLLGAFAADPGPPADHNRFVVFHTKETEQARPFDNRNQGPFMRAIRAVARRADSIFEVRVHASRYLQVQLGMQVPLDANGRLAQSEDNIASTHPFPYGQLRLVQTSIDGTRRLLREELGFADDAIVDVPCLLTFEAGAWVAVTADSVNMLVLAHGNGSRCLIPKPFGPIYDGVYVFQRYLERILNGWHIEHSFLVDDLFHVDEGEIHCGTNQVPQPLPAERAWWLQEPV
ncbi:MAG: protein-arginine deiminase family protein [bacterium]